MYADALSSGDSRVLGLYFNASCQRTEPNTSCLYGVPGLLRSLCSQILARFPGQQGFHNKLDETYLERIRRGKTKDLLDHFRVLIWSINNRYGVRAAVPITVIIDQTQYLENHEHQSDYYDFMMTLRTLVDLCRENSNHVRNLEFKYLLINTDASLFAWKDLTHKYERRVTVDPVAIRGSMPGAFLPGPFLPSQFMPNLEPPGAVPITEKVVHMPGQIYSPPGPPFYAFPEKGTPLRLDTSEVEELYRRKFASKTGPRPSSHGQSTERSDLHQNQPSASNEQGRFPHGNPSDSWWHLPHRQQSTGESGWTNPYRGNSSQERSQRQQQSTEPSGSANPYDGSSGRERQRPSDTRTPQRTNTRPQARSRSAPLPDGPTWDNGRRKWIARDRQ